MALDTEEQQQVEEVKKWLSENGWFLFFTIVIVAVGLFGYQQWNKYRADQAGAASIRYEHFLNDWASKQTGAVDQEATALIKNYPHSIYAQLTQLLVAKRTIDSGNFSDGAGQLTAVINKADLPALKEIARLRLARLQIQEKNPQAALHTLQKIDAEAYRPAVAAVQGDAYAALNNVNAARMSYHQALAGLPEDALLHSIVSMQLNNLSSSAK